MLPSWRSFFLLALCTTCPASFGTQEAAPADMTTRALVYVQDHAVYGCGIRIVGSASGDALPAQWFDISVNLYRDGFGMVKALSYDIRGAALAGGKPLDAVPVEDAWLKPENSDAPKPQGEGIQAGDQPGSIVYPILPEDADRLLHALLGGRKFVIGVKREGSSPERVFSGNPALSTPDSVRIFSCIDGLRQRPAGKFI